MASLSNSGLVLTGGPESISFSHLICHKKIRFRSVALAERLFFEERVDSLHALREIRH